MVHPGINSRCFEMKSLALKVDSSGKIRMFFALRLGGGDSMSEGKAFIASPVGASPFLRKPLATS